MTADVQKPIRQPRIIAIDFMRIFAVLLVVLVHILTQPVIYSMVLPEAFLVVFHVSREIFLIITGLVLTYTSGKFSGWGWLKFYWRRYPLVVIPYIAWTLIYLFTSGTHLLPVVPFLRTLFDNLQSGNASYQLYFLIVTMKLYLVFPFLYTALKALKRYHTHIVVISFILQLFLTAAIRYSWWFGSIHLAVWFSNPDAALLSYQFYIFAGCIAAWHMEAITTFARTYYKKILYAALASTIIALLSYWWQLNHGSWALQASQVFQPSLVIESLAATIALFAIGVRWADNGAKYKKTFLLLSDVSFGIYLCHLLILSWISYWAGRIGLFNVAANESTFAIVLFMIFIVTPLVYAISALGIAVLRLTPLSLFLAGRPFARKAKDEMKPTTKTSVAV